MYNGVKISARIQDVVSKYFSFFHKITTWSTLSPYVLTLVLDVLTENIQELVPQSMLYVDDIILVRDSREELNGKLEMWRQTLEAHRFRISRRWGTNFILEVKIGDHIKLQVTRFWYFRQIIQDDGEIDGYVNHKT
ncbi:hypothetical protein Lal_00018303 [Lupinus albus]|nr:hypothetical protein Lal_00018303 [Lupinus albus]